MVARPAKLAASAIGPYGTSSMTGWCSGSPDDTTSTNLSERGSRCPATVSYTHLTLPTICSV
eukprot:2269810-Alexandrium_andersonii.AAC.1